MSIVAADDRAYLSVGQPARYAIGDPASPYLILNAADPSGCLWIADSPDGWDAPTVTLPMDRRQTGDGGYGGTPTYEPRVLTVDGAVTAPTPVELARAQRRLLGAVLGSAPAFVRYSHLDDAYGAMGLWVQPSGKPKWRALDDRYAEFSFILIAEDPIKTGTLATYGPVRLPSSAGEGGYPMPWTAPVTAAASSVPAALTVVTVPNAGDSASQVVYTVTGPVPQPMIVLGTGAYVRLNADLAAGDTWVVDTAAGTFTVNGVNRYDAWGAGSVFPLIPGSSYRPDGSITPGGTTAVLRSATGGNDQAAGLIVATAPSWR